MVLIPQPIQPVTDIKHGNVPDIRKTRLNPNHWFPVARSKDLKTGKPLGKVFQGEPIVLVRTAKGTVYALEDRCAHRQVPLRLGNVKGEFLQCTYHCWTYASSGACVNVPYLDKGKTLPNGVKSYPCREAYGFVFVFPGQATETRLKDFPTVTSWGTPAYKTRYLDRRVDCHYSFMHENLMDMNHQFLHRKLMGGILTKFLDLRRGKNWVECDYTFDRVKGKPSWGETFILGKRVEPSAQRPTDIMTIRTQYPYQTLKFWTAGSEHPALDLWNCYIPVDGDDRINHTFGLMNIRRPGIPGIINLLWPFIVWFTNGIFAEDRRICELEQAAFDSQGSDWNNEIFPVIQNLRELLIEHGVQGSVADG